MIEVLSLGAGVQSSTVLLMSIEGELPPLEAVIFADTGWEPRAVYAQMDWLQEKAESAGIDVYRVSVGNIKEDALTAQKAGGTMDRDPEMKAKAKAKGAHPNSGRWVSMPLFTLGPDGERGQKRRQCTYEYKIRAIETCMRRQVLQLKPRQRAPKEPVVRQWFGISWDERTRMRLPDFPWKTNWYPLVERHMTRLSCLDWMESHSYPRPPRSACIGCPYHSNTEWRELKVNSPTEWEEAVEFDRAIRKCGGMRGDVFLHADRIPLEDVDLRNDFDKGQMELFPMENECAGICGV